MDIFESVKIAVTTLTANKLRSSLTMLGIAIGNAAVIALVGIGQGAQNYTSEQLESYGANSLFVYLSLEDTEGSMSEIPQLVLSDAEAIATTAPAVKAVAPQIGSQLSISYLNRNTKSSVTGTTPGFLYVRNMAVAQGRFFNSSEQQQNVQVVTLGSELARKLFGSEDPLGKEVKISNASFLVIGVMKAKGAGAGQNFDDAAYVPITTMADQLTGRRSPYGIPIDSMQVSAKDKQSIRTAAFQITNILTQLRGKQDISVASDKSFNDLINQVTQALSLTLAAIASISLLVGGIGIMNIMLVSVTERTQEIGLRKAVGATQSAILTQFLIEAIILSVAGGLIGIGVGISGTTIVGIFTPLTPSVPVGAIALAVGVSGGIGLIFGVVPARRAAQLDPIVALRSA
ncbi:ABC transporter permease [Nostoc sp. UHCC 0252]|uniref:ABC transporter permease n=1 Tax=Nostoc sp. UHCC 0252 TaxID=3110241 RepID=UPI002B204206|nr:ABC transporter permease [Nostoc sp. UHCC 0252]MEA5604854.1 ABC transporter permease [Nostoc sp. UHCC 0252]